METLCGKLTHLIKHMDSIDATTSELLLELDMFCIREAKQLSITSPREMLSIAATLYYVGHSKGTKEGQEHAKFLREMGVSSEDV